MIGDELGEKVVSVQFRAGEKLTGAILKKLFHALIKGGAKGLYHATSNEVNIHKLAGDGAQTHGIEVTKAEMQGFDRYAKKYHVFYSLTREKNDKSQYMFMFKLKDFDRLESAMKDYFKDDLDHSSLQEKIEQAREKAFEVNKAHEREKEKSKTRAKGRDRSKER